jgi:8-oxo-dGTP diphosphatase
VAIRLWPFLCELEEGEPEALEHAALRWLDPGDLGGVELAPADVAVAMGIQTGEVSLDD